MKSSKDRTSSKDNKHSATPSPSKKPPSKTRISHSAAKKKAEERVSVAGAFEEQPAQLPAPTDFVLKTLLGEFNGLAKRKMEEMIAYGVDRTERLSDMLSSDPMFTRLVESIAELSKT